MKALICGGRNYPWIKVVQWLTDNASRLGITSIIEGRAKGGDFGAFTWANINGIPIQSFKADWDKYGRRAGYLRNLQMMEEGQPDIVIAFPGGVGTAMMIDISKKNNKEIIIVKDDTNNSRPTL